MSTHSGKVTLDASWVQRLLILADPLLRQKAREDALEEAAKVCEQQEAADHCAAAIRALKEGGK